MFGFGKKKKIEEAEEESFKMPEDEIGDRLLPEDLAKFKLKGPFEETVEKASPKPFGLPAREARREAPAQAGGDTEMILTRLDAVEARLKVVEEKMRRL